VHKNEAQVTIFMTVPHQTHASNFGDLPKSDFWRQNRASYQPRKLLPDLIGRSQIEAGRLERRVCVNLDTSGVRAWFMCQWPCEMRFLSKNAAWLVRDEMHKFCHGNMLAVRLSSKLTRMDLEWKPGRRDNPHPRVRGPFWENVFSKVKNHQRPMEPCARAASPS
jgi:hypothetical protein